MDTSDLANRMKEYEKRNQYYLQKRTPVAIRVDGRSFHTFTKGFKRPFDDVLIKTMQETAKYMCENMGNAKFAYVQSDEITIILTDYDTLDTDCWFNYRTDKLCSISASMATMAFNKFFANNVNIFRNSKAVKGYSGQYFGDYEDAIIQLEVYEKAIDKGAMFDARCFNIPKEEVTNLIYWRQLDATRNSIQMVGQANFSHKELQNKSCNDIQNMLHEQKGINWNDLPIYQKRGSCCIKKEYAVNDNGEEVEIDCVTDVDEPIENVTFKSRWIIDTQIPIFKGEDRAYVDNLIYIGE